MPVLTAFETSYVVAWSAITLAAFAYFVSDRKASPLFRTAYYRHLLRPWKIVTFAVATAALCWLSTLGYDPTWDVPETLAMSAMAFVFAPYSVGTAYRYAKGIRKNGFEFLAAVVLIFFASAWFYDAYAAIFLLGEYPWTAFSNLGLSPFFFILAGIFWSMECDGERFGFSFARNEWYEAEVRGKCPASALLAALPIVVFMVAIFWRFVWLNR